MKKFDVVALGELLIDFTENGISSQGNLIFEANPGGAPCNVLAMLQKLGKKTAFIGKVGNDIFGGLLTEVVQSAGIDVTNLVTDSKVPTTLAFVHTLAGGDREFSFIRDPGADMMLRKDEIDEEILKSAKILHFGTLSSTHEGVREATRYAVDIAKESGALISFDPNLRTPLWNSLEDARREIVYGLEKCDILKISDNEIEFMTGSTDYDKAVRELMEKYQIKLAFATLGKNGSRAYNGDIKAECGVFKVDTIETTGAGDTFCGSTLNYILEHDINCLTENDLEELLTFANAAAAIITTRRGALKVMPEKKEILELIGR
ncbi:MAG: PfkB family carbohydrate kinase [Oscillospiraceae bacterium]